MKTICDVNRITPPGGIHAKGDQFRDTELLVAVVRTRIPSRNGASGWIVREILACRPIRVESGSSEGNSKSSSDRTTDGESPKTASQNSNKAKFIHTNEFYVGIRPLILIPERDSQLQTKYPLEDEASTCSFRREPSGSGVSDRPAENRTREIEPSNSQPKPGRIAAPQTYEKQKIQSDELRDQPETSQEVRKSSRTSEKQRIRGVCVKIWGHYRVLWLKDGRLAVYDCREWPEQGERRVQLGRFYEVFVSKLDTPVLDKKLNYGWEITDCRAIPDVHQPIVDEKKANFRCRNLVFTSYRQEKNKRVPILKDEFFGEIPDRNEILADPAPGDKFHVVIRAVPKSDSGLEWIVHSDFIEEERPPMAVVPPFDQMRRNSLESTTLPYDQRSVSSSRTNDELYRINEVSSTPKDELRAASSLMENSELSFDESIQRVPEVTDKFLELADLMLK
ncbi:unnamed protein product, partial [Mesorhabditis spiculigera]